ncbi:MAG: PEP-CTERM sorting domain-containing protein [Fimbriimonadaceae bacterium]
MRGAIFVSVVLAAVGAQAQVTLFNSSDPANNAATRTAWLAAAGVAAPDFLEDFESYAIGTSLQSVSLIGGATITDSNATPVISVQSSSTFFGGSVPFGKGLALRETHAYTFAFAAPISYFGMYDIDQGGSSFRVFLADSSFVDFSGLDSTASSGSSGEFVGFVAVGPMITSIQFNADGGDNEVGIDELQYGAAVPEPTTMIALALGAAVVGRRKRK